MTRPQTITLAGEAYVVVPLSEYEALRHAVDEDALDAAAMRRVLEDPNEESVPIEVVDRLLAGENPVRVWREFRGMKGVLNSPPPPEWRLLICRLSRTGKSQVQSMP